MARTRVEAEESGASPDKNGMEHNYLSSNTATTWDMPLSTYKKQSDVMVYLNITTRQRWHEIQTLDGILYAFFMFKACYLDPQRAEIGGLVRRSTCSRVRKELDNAFSGQDIDGILNTDPEFDSSEDVKWKAWTLHRFVQSLSDDPEGLWPGQDAIQFPLKARRCCAWTLLHHIIAETIESNVARKAASAERRAKPTRDIGKVTQARPELLSNVRTSTLTTSVGSSTSEPPKSSPCGKEKKSATISVSSPAARIFFDLDSVNAHNNVESDDLHRTIRTTAGVRSNSDTRTIDDQNTHVTPSRGSILNLEEASEYDFSDASDDDDEEGGVSILH